jgi:MerR family transcriptional regulator/heat shock protein HspR
MKFWTVSEIIETLQLDKSFLQNLEKEEIICPRINDDCQTKLFSEKEFEKLRIAKVLIEEMEVNLAGVEVILQMRKNMIEMRNQFDSILSEISKKIQADIKTHI